MENKVKNICRQCSKEIPSKREFCSRSCHISYQNHLLAGVSYIERYGEEHANKKIAKQRAGLIKTVMETGFTKIGGKVSGDKRRCKTFEQQYGIQKALQIRKQLSEKSSRSYEEQMGIEKAILKREKMSKSMTKIWSDPEYHDRTAIKMNEWNSSQEGIDFRSSLSLYGKVKRGYFDNVFYGSGLELEFLHGFKRRIGSLLIVQRSKLAIPYDGHNTYPDFKILNVNNETIAIIEIKGSHLLNDKLTITKLNALRDYCKVNGLMYGLYTKDIFNYFYGNPEPRQLPFLLSELQDNMDNKLSNCKVQRLETEDERSNNVSNSAQLPK